MAEPLYAGKMGSAASAAVPGEYLNSLAQRMEDAYWSLLAAEQRFDRSTNTEQDRDRRRIFVAIAQGVVEYLHDHPGAFRVLADGVLPANTRVVIDRNT